MIDLDDGPLPKANPRDAVMGKAAGELAGAVEEIRKRHGLESAELLYVLTTELDRFGAEMLRRHRREVG